MATTKEQRMQAIRDRRAKEEAAQAAHTREFDRRTAETNKRIAERNRQRDLEANKTVIPPFNPAFVDRTNVTYNNSTQDGGRNRPNVPPIHNNLSQDGGRYSSSTNPLYNNLSQDGGRYSSNTSPLYNNLSQDGGRNQATSSVTPMSPAEEAVVDNDIELARIQQAMSGVDVNPEFVQRAMQNANANGDTRVTPQTLAGTPSIIDRMSQWGDDVWDSFFDEEISTEAIATAKSSLTSNVTSAPAPPSMLPANPMMPYKDNMVNLDYNNQLAAQVPPVAEQQPAIIASKPQPTMIRPHNTVAPMEYTAPMNADQRVIDNLTERNGGLTPAIDPTVRVPDQVVNGTYPRAPVSAPTDYPMGPTILINKGAGQEEDLTPQLVPDMPQNGGPDRGGYPNKTRLPNNPNAAPQRPGYKVVKSSDGSPVKSGNGYAWTKDYQHSIWGDK